MEGRGSVPSTSAHLHAHTYMHTHTSSHAQAHSHRHGSHTETHDATPLPSSEKESWIQTLVSHQHRDTNTCVHTSLWSVMQKTREKRVQQVSSIR